MKFYHSEHGQFDDRGEAVTTSLNGLGRLPVGRHANVTVVSVVKEDTSSTIILTHDVRGGHVETLPSIDWLLPLIRVVVEIELLFGCYLRRRSDGTLALFSADTEEQLSDWGFDVVSQLYKHKLALPSLTMITDGNNIWRRTRELSVPKT